MKKYKYFTEEDKENATQKEITFLRFEKGCEENRSIYGVYWIPASNAIGVNFADIFFCSKENFPEGIKILTELCEKYLIGVLEIIPGSNRSYHFDYLIQLK